MTGSTEKQNEEQREGWMEVRRVFPVIAGLLMVAAIFLPLWSVGMNAPQYPGQTLEIRIYADRMAGDIREYNILNRYAGISFPDYLPEFEIFPKLLVGFGIFSILMGLVPAGIRNKGLLILLVLFTLFLIVGAVDLQYRLYVIGNELDPNAPMVGIEPFTPPILGPNKVANFTTLSLLRAGSFALGIAYFLVLAAYLNRNSTMEGTQWLTNQKDKISKLFGKAKKPAEEMTR
jgi:hypothetical protein